MSDLVEFLLARIEEDEGYAQESNAHTPWPSVPVAIGMTQSSALGLHLDRFSAARMLAECKAKRELIAEINQMEDQIANEWGDGGGDPDGLKALARIWAGHPDFDPWWAK